MRVRDWFTDALADVPRADTVVVDGALISYLTWGRSFPGVPDLLLAHGGAAHAHWWDHIAPALATGRRVVAIDYSGHGDSDHRPVYSLDGWADELAAVIAASGLAGPPAVIGHSMGGMIAVALARRGETALSGAIIVDSPIEPSDPPPRPESDPVSFGNARVYATADDAVKRFRPVPAQSMLDFVAKHIAETSLREVPGGWGWKFDPAFLNLAGEPPRTLDGLSCPVVMILGQHGLLSDEARRALRASEEAVVIEIPDAGHAIMLDQPQALLAAIQSTLDRWEKRVG